MGSHQSGLEGQKHLPRPTGYASFNIHSPISSSLSHPGGNSRSNGQRYSCGVSAGLGRGQRDPHTELCQGTQGTGWTSQERRRKAQSSRLSQPFIYVSDDISVPLLLPREKQRASKAKGIYLICHASKTQADNREDGKPDLRSMSEDKHMTASQRGASLNCSHAFPWERGNCFGFFFLIFLL